MQDRIGNKWVAIALRNLVVVPLLTGFVLQLAPWSQRGGDRLSGRSIRWRRSELLPEGPISGGAKEPRQKPFLPRAQA